MPDWLGKLKKLNNLYLNRMNLDEIPPLFSNLTKLSLVMMEDNSIHGSIPSSFMNLTQLRVINLAGNKFHGPIPSSFSNFKRLQLLSLLRNDFRVDLDMFVGLNQLDTLYLSGNKISFVATSNYTNGSLPELKILGLSSCDLKKFPAILRFRHKLNVLFLSDNKIGGRVPEWMWNKNLESLEIIDLESNFITGFHQHQNFLPWGRLKYFSIAYNQLQGRVPIPPRTMVVYDVSNNNLQGEIPPLLCELNSLLLLDLSSNNINGTLPSCLGRLSNSLLVLDLKGNNFQGTMMNTFTQGCMLRKIDLSENQIVGQVSKSLTNCINLEFLSLGDNSFDDTFPFWLGTLVELQVLMLGSNRFYGGIQGPTMVISQFPKLRIIDLSNNGFGGPLPHEYFQSWNAMKSVYDGKSSFLQSRFPLLTFELSIPYKMTITSKGVKREYPRILDIFTVIDLSCNNFEGQIPQSLQDLRGLESLNLSNNYLIGGVLSSLGNLKNLESLDLSRNELSGEIPHQLLQLGFLAILNLSFNHLHGRIPQGGQFNTFESNSYEANPGLCGEPLSNDCQDSKASTPPQTSEKSESFFPSERVDWIVIFSGVGSGLVVGIVIGNFLYARYSDWFSTRKDKWVRPLRN
ncbi:Leucine-rich repeat-containing protein [Cynara cardunculus var. scolymus]|uniref:Leucine-rich repeat-containing protein n=3 Tax=Cynara cardunculus var. scolymus TaxID=59895 RepID=A0A118K6E9_CYNCS|nr:Leucine-rich repeat-containing protein [Cynara cardunculus var. scolymus]